MLLILNIETQSGCIVLFSSFAVLEQGST